LGTTPIGATRFATWRRDHGLTLAECSGLTGYSPGHLSRVERGQRTLKPLVKVRIARALGAQVDELFEPQGAE